jgi:hypothetical protein
MSTYSRLVNDFHNRDGLFLPDSEIYCYKSSGNSTEIIAKKIFVWLGIKPNSITYSDNLVVDDKKALRNFTISATSHQHPMVNVAGITKQCMEYFLTRKKVDINPEITEKAIIDFGLSLLVINSFQSDKIIGNFLKNNNSQENVLNSLNKKDFCRRFNDYVRNNQLDNDIIIEHTIKSSRPYLDFKHSGRTKERNESFVITENNRQQKNKTKFVLLIACICASFVLVTFLYSQKPKGLTKEVLAQKNEINTLEQSYRSCISNLKVKQQSYDLDDVYMVRQIQAQFNECTSIKNNYDYKVQQYNKKINAL